MSRPAELDTQVGYAGDPYTIIVVIEGRAYIPANTWASMARRRVDDAAALATFTVTARAGTVDDEATGEDETGNTVAVCYLDGAGTRAAVGESIVDVQETPADGDPTTWVRYRLNIQGDATR